MNERSHNRGGFTVMELLIVTIIIAVIAAFAIPSYEKAMTRQKVRRLILTANLIGGAQEIYKAKNGRYWGVSDGADMDATTINAGLGLNIISEEGVFYDVFALIGLENTNFDVHIFDAATFDLQTTFPPPPLNIVCTNTTAMKVCP
ncbi:MAG: prepilin-type N-terminal cleavage/methylation domain-containing protein [Candidatus Omnitrophica bacterium]|nr:prepilin-type N-terminal cleavage/methylation domain-containing protein [Candidatus Omnitrophota bacterium]